mmetsp:Transcript_13735/g.51249  ORF Transcript_13735/g.51249 Transcript_13735/m.51249 type:complete len:251 (-) Transcript_13735:900-1652(-)
MTSSRCSSVETFATFSAISSFTRWRTDRMYSSSWFCAASRRWRAASAASIASSFALDAFSCASVIGGYSMKRFVASTVKLRRCTVVFGPEGCFFFFFFFSFFSDALAASAAFSSSSAALAASTSSFPSALSPFSWPDSCPSFPASSAAPSVFASAPAAPASASAALSLASAAASSSSAGLSFGMVTSSTVASALSRTITPLGCNRKVRLIFGASRPLSAISFAKPATPVTLYVPKTWSTPAGNLEPSPTS